MAADEMAQAWARQARREVFILAVYSGHGKSDDKKIQLDGGSLSSTVCI